jgi:hypothetical protein
MQFLNPRKYNGTNKHLQSNTLLPNPLLPFLRKNAIKNNVPPAEPITREVVPVSKNDPTKIKWGPPTWYLFHTLLHKIKDEYFLLLKLPLFNNIVTICRNLPCPTCSTHATDYMNKINPATIKTKDDFKNMMFQFHNEVNSRTGAPLFSYVDLNAKYDTAITINIIQNFFIYFKDKTFNVTAIANSMHRDRIVLILSDWFRKNIQYFDT